LPDILQSSIFNLQSSFFNTVRYFLRLSFDGKPFHGWQVQKNAHSVQAELNHALATVLNIESIETIGCGRTDTGVHAEKFYVHFDYPPVDNTGTLIHKLNSVLPPAIAVHSLFEVEQTAHARFSATSRTYLYRMYAQKNPFLRDRAYYFPHDTDMERMNRFAATLKSHTDFSSFSKSRTQTRTNNCVITFARWRKEEGELRFTITADRFLRNMVRAIVGTLLLAGMNKINEEEFSEILKSKDRSEAGMSVPAHGLYLTDVEYPFPVK
jgi:tRNA pseudouridine38-40 synthase